MLTVNADANNLSCSDYQAMVANNTYLFQTGEDVQLSARDGDTFICEVKGKVFRDQDENYIRQTVG